MKRDEEEKSLRDDIALLDQKKADLEAQLAEYTQVSFDWPLSISYILVQMLNLQILEQRRQAEINRLNAEIEDLSRKYEKTKI